MSIIEKVKDKAIKKATEYALGKLPPIFGAGSPKQKGDRSAFKYTPFRTSTDRLSIDKNIERVYSDNGTIYWTPTYQEDTPRWSHYYDPKTDTMIPNWYGNKISRAGQDIASSEQVQRLLQYPNLVSNGNNIKKESDKTIQSNINVYANQTQLMHDNFRADMEAALQRNGMNSVGMVNDTKRKEIIDSLALNKPDQAKEFLSKGKGPNQKIYEDNASKKYDDRYKNNPAHLSKKKIPNYTSGPSIKHDEYNKLYSVDDEVSKLPTEIQPWENWDFIPFFLHDIVNKKYLPFRAYLNSISDQSDSSWSSVRYLGRADEVKIYQGFTRQVSIDFTTACFSLKELHPMWQRLNYLVGLTKPAGYRTDDPDSVSIRNSSFVIPPFLKLRLGDMYDQQPCILTSCSLSIPTEASWELTSDKKNQKDYYEFLNGTITTRKEDEILVGQYPNMAEVSLSFEFLEKRLPKTNNRHFGHHRREDEPLNEEIPDSDSDIDKGFNYNLIHPLTKKVQKEELEKEAPTELPEDPPVKGADSDPLVGVNNFGCSTYPPSHYYVQKSSGNMRSKTEERIQSELEEWKKCACENVAQLMGEEGADSCQWEGDCIKSINGKEVPPSLTCQFNTELTDNPEEEEDDIKQPPKCPYPIGGLNEKDSYGRMIGYDDKEAFEADDSQPYKASLKRRNLEFWIKDVCDFLATKMGKPKIGSGSYVFKVSENGESNPPLSRIRYVASSNGSVKLLFSEDGIASTYCGEPLEDEYKSDFKINCTSDDIELNREIAGHTQPLLYVDLNDKFKIYLDYPFKEKYKNQDDVPKIDNSNYNNIDAVKKLLAEFVVRMTSEDNTIFKYGDLSSEEHDGTAIAANELYFAPYEENRDTQITAHKSFPGTKDYVYYEINEDVSEQLKLGEGKKYAELKFGFYALVSKTKDKISGTGFDKKIESEVCDHLFKELISMNKFYDINDAGDGVRDISGGSQGMGSTDDKSDKLDPGDESKYVKEIERLEKVKNTENNIQKQIQDPNVPIIEYNVVGRWTEGQKLILKQRMQDPKYSKTIAELWNNNNDRVEIENMIMLLDPTLPEDESLKNAKQRFAIKVQNGRLVEGTKLGLDETNQDYIQKKIDDNKEELEKIQKKKKNGEIEKNSFEWGYYFDKDTSSGHFVPWKAEHTLPTIKFIDDGKYREKPKLRNRDAVLERPAPVTDTPTRNKTPSWSWTPVEGATIYEITFDGKITITDKLNFTPKNPDGSKKRLKSGKHYIRVRAGSQDFFPTKWSTEGIHQVQIDPFAIPKKPPKCPYLIGGLNEKDEYNRLIGYTEENVSASGKTLKDIYDAGDLSDTEQEKLVERNIKLWIGDVTSYIIAKEDIKNIPFPCENASSVSWTTDDYTAVSTYEGVKVEWTYMGKTLTKNLNLSPDRGVPISIDGFKLGEGGNLTYKNVFSSGCGPRVGQTKRGGEGDDSADEELIAPRPHIDTPTSESQPTWNWTKVDGADKYKVSLRHLYRDEESGGVHTNKDFGIVKYSSDTFYKPRFALENGEEYEISVIAEDNKMGSDGTDVVVRKSKPGKQIILVVTSTPSPKPTPSPTPEPAEPFKYWINSIPVFDAGGSYGSWSRTVWLSESDKRAFKDKIDSDAEEDWRLTEQDGFNKYKETAEFKNKVWQGKEPIPFMFNTRNDTSNKKDSNVRVPNCYAGIVRNIYIPNAKYKAPPTNERELIKQWLMLPVNEFEEESFDPNVCYGRGMSEAEAENVISNFAWKDGNTPDKSPYWTANLKFEEMESNDF